MHKVNKQVLHGIILGAVCCVFLAVPVLSSAAGYPDPGSYVPTFDQLRQHKKNYDDPRPVLKEFGPKQVLPPEMYKSLTWDVEQMKAAWSDLVGFKAPDVVGKKAPSIKPGKYTYQDLEKYPELKELFIPELLDRIKPGEPPFVGNVSEFEIVPTEQFYWALPVAEETKKNMGKTQLRDDGYLVNGTWAGGYPFPRPEGKNKAWNVMYNVEKRYVNFGLDFVFLGYNHGYNKNMVMDFECDYIVRQHRLSGRCFMEPYGFFDARAEKRGEFRSFIMPFLSPRDIAGQVQQATYFVDPERADQLYLYIPSLRRVRKLSATDSQDPVAGQDVIYDDNEGFMQKLSPTRYPYKTEILQETEFLVPFVEDGSEYVASKGVEYKGLKFQRRPIYVVQMTQLDPNYVYSKRILYIDRETFNHYMQVNFDQKGRLYRTGWAIYAWYPDMGMFEWGAFQTLRDHIDTHSCMQMNYCLPTAWQRDDISMAGVVSSAK